MLKSKPLKRRLLVFGSILVLVIGIAIVLIPRGDQPHNSNAPPETEKVDVQNKAKAAKAIEATATKYNEYKKSIDELIKILSKYIETDESNRESNRPNSDEVKTISERIYTQSEELKQVFSTLSQQSEESEVEVIGKIQSSLDDISEKVVQHLRNGVPDQGEASDDIKKIHDEFNIQQKPDDNKSYGHFGPETSTKSRDFIKQKNEEIEEQINALPEVRQSINTVNTVEAEAKIEDLETKIKELDTTVNTQETEIDQLLVRVNQLEQSDSENNDNSDRNQWISTGRELFVVLITTGLLLVVVVKIFNPRKPKKNQRHSGQQKRPAFSQSNSPMLNTDQLVEYIDQRIDQNTQEKQQEFRAEFAQIRAELLQMIATEVNRYQLSIAQESSTSASRPVPVPSSSPYDPRGQQDSHQSGSGFVGSYNQNPYSLKQNAIEVSETKQSLQDRRAGYTKLPVMEESRNGNYWIIEENIYEYMVPNPKSQINPHNYKTTQAFFECEGYSSSGYSRIQVIKPAKVQSISQGKWELKEKGYLKFI